MQGTCIDIQRKSNNWSYPCPSIAKTKPQGYFHSFSWAEKLFHKEAEGKDKDSKEKYVWHF